MIELKLFSPRRVIRALVPALLALAGALTSPGSFGANMPDLYEAAVPAPDRSAAGLGLAFQAALKIVLVRVTGQRAAPQDPAFAALIGNARRYMQQYRSGSGNQIWVTFDAPALERWLAQNRQPLWGRERPSTAIWVGVSSGSGAGSIVTHDDQSELKRSLDLQATVRGIPLVWPTPADVERSGVTYANLGQASASAFGEGARRLGADGVLIGRGSESGAAAGIRWTFLFQGHSTEFSGAAEGIDRAADAYAVIFAASGESTAVNLEVTGVSDLQTYASIQSYLESLTLISRVSILGFDSDKMKLRVIARGGAEPLQRALTQDSRLEPVDGAEPGMLRFHAHR